MPIENQVWERISRSVIQEGRKVASESKALEVLVCLPNVLNVCGDFSQSRKIAQRIGCCLLLEQPVIIAPACPDYSHLNGKYDFKSLRGGVSLLATKHISFLEKVTRILPQVKVKILVADHEADDLELCRVTGVSQEEFREFVDGTVKEVKKQVQTYGWKVVYMTEEIPQLVEEENKTAEWIKNNPEMIRWIARDIQFRSDMYQRINPLMTDGEKSNRTIKTAAQYLVLGREACKKRWLICNHTTTNLAWYIQTGAAVLHNPVSIY